MLITNLPPADGAVTGTILVGVDGSPGSLRALEWAVTRARAGQSSLRIVHAYELTMPIDPWGFIAWWDPGLFEFADRVLDEAARHAHELAPHLPISTSLQPRAPAAGLVLEGRAAELIVLGRSRRRWWGFLTRTVNAKVACRARGRVVIVGPDDEELC